MSHLDQTIQNGSKERKNRARSSNAQIDTKSKPQPQEPNTFIKQQHQASTNSKQYLANAFDAQNRCYLLLFLFFVVFCVCLVSVLFFSVLGESVYMDEQFHARQTQVYCIDHDYGRWDSKITTLPGLYLISSFWAYSTSLVLEPPIHLLNHLLYDDMYNITNDISNREAVNDEQNRNKVENQESTFQSYRLTNTSLEAHNQSSDYLESVIVQDRVDSSDWSALLIRRFVLIFEGKSSLNRLLCSNAHLRLFVNPLLSILNIILIHLLMKDDRKNDFKASKNKSHFGLHLLKVLAIWSFPISFFFNFLYYTDTGGLTTILLLKFLIWKKFHFFGFLTSLAAILFRQTNIIWIIFLLCSNLIEEIYENELKKQKRTKFKINSKQVKIDSLSDNLSLNDNIRSPIEMVSSGLIGLKESFFGFFACFLSFLTSFVPIAIKYIYFNLFNLIREYLLYGIVVVMFGWFVWWNEGITVGDKAAHQPVLHIPQILYFASFKFIFAWPIFIFGRSSDVVSSKRASSTLNTKSFISHLIYKARLLIPIIDHLYHLCLSFIRFPVSQMALLLGFCLFCFFAIKNFTISHLYLISDNRHYTFYIWNRLFVRYDWFRYVPMIPIYCLAFWAILRRKIFEKNEKQEEIVGEEEREEEEEEKEEEEGEREEEGKEEGEEEKEEEEGEREEEGEEREEEREEEEEEKEEEEKEGEIRGEEYINQAKDDLKNENKSKMTCKPSKSTKSTKSIKSIKSSIHIPSHLPSFIPFRVAWLIVFLLMTSSALIPSPLIEFRYFIIPFNLLMINLLKHEKSKTSLVLQILSNTFINVITIYIFLYKPFKWNNSNEPIARFMW